MVTPLFIQLFYNNIYVSSKNEEADLMKTVQLLDFHFIPNCLKMFKVVNWKLWEQVLLMTLISVMIRSLWLIMVIYCIFLKKCQCLNCNNSYNICPCARCVKIGCLLSLFQKKNRTKNVKMLLQNNCINNGITMIPMVKQKRRERRVWMVNCITHTKHSYLTFQL